VTADFLGWLEGTAVATWTRQSPSIWAYPTILTLHTVGLAVVVGATGLVNLRVLGIGTRIPLAELVPLFRFVWWAFGLNAVTGVLLFMADATTKARQTIFYVKLAFIALALGCTVRLARMIRGVSLRDADPTPPPASVDALVSLFLWTAAIVAGRLMAYF
jgi:hypothetical protein